VSSRADALKDKEPELVADLWLYSTEQGGRKGAITLGWGCPCSAQRTIGEGWDGYPLLGDQAMKPGETRRAVGFVFLSGATAADKLRASGKFYLWEGRFIGEAVVVPPRLSK